MITDKDIEQFYKDLESLNLKFPNAYLEERTGYSKGIISEFLNRKREPSEKFLKKFYAGFHDELNKNNIKLTTVTAKPNFGDEKPVKPNDDKLVNVVVSQQDTIKMLTEALTKLIAKG